MATCSLITYDLLYIHPPPPPHFSQGSSMTELFEDVFEQVSMQEIDITVEHLRAAVTQECRERKHYIELLQV